MLWDLTTISNYLHLGENPIQFGAVVRRNRDFVRYIAKPFHHGKFSQKGDSHYHTMNTEFHTPFEWFMFIDVSTKLG